jgi:formate hydrogenlyase transcriptional activator
MKTMLDKKYEIILDLINSIIYCTDEESLFKKIIEKLKEVINYDRLSINIYDEKNNTVSYFTTASGLFPIDIDTNNRPLEKASIAHYVITSRQPLFIKNLANYLHWPSVKSMYNSGIRVTIAYPLISRNKILGSFHISFKKIPEKAEQSFIILNDISGQIAIAVDNIITSSNIKNLVDNLKAQNTYLKKQTDTEYSKDNFFFKSDKMKKIIKLAELVSQTEVSVLITGETGTGKDFLARLIHNSSVRKNNQFIKVSCPDLPASIFESELFGHVKGAYTGANDNRIGRFEMADEGTIFLDEISEIPLELQAKLLQVIQEKKINRVGDNKTKKLNFRTIVATNKNLIDCIKNNCFRSDLYYRINSFPIHIPPLRERKEEIPYLINMLSKQENNSLQLNEPYLTPEAIEYLTNYKWPGNIRELKNILRYLIILYHGKEITVSNIKETLNFNQNDEPLSCDNAYYNNEDTFLTLREIEKKHIENALRKCKGKISGKNGAAVLLGLPRTTLNFKIKKYNINPKTI